MTMDTAAPPNVSSQSPIYTDWTRQWTRQWAGYWSRHGRMRHALALGILLLLLGAEWLGVRGQLASMTSGAAALVIGVLGFGTGTALVAGTCVHRARLLRAAMAALAWQVEQLATAEQGRTVPLTEAGPPDVARLSGAINAARRHSAERESELLTMQASYVHDLRTPLTRLVLRCDLIEDPSLRAAMERDLDEMRELAEAGLACARMQSGQAQKPRDVDADGMLAALVRNYRDAGCALVLDGQVGRSVLTCPHALRRILVNLVDNALRYGSDVRVSVRMDDRHLHLAVLDSGPGIAPTELEAVFRPWYRSAETATRGPGSGLGLAIARRLALAIRGELALRNRCEGGLEARLSLPL